MRVNVMFGLDHVKATERRDEVMRLIEQLGKRLQEKPTVVVGDSIVLFDSTGKRVGVADVYEW